MMSTGTAPEPVRVLCAADETYAGALCVMLTSLVIHFAKDREIDIYVMGSDITEPSRRKIETSICTNRPGFKLSCLHWLSPDRKALQDLPISEHITLEAYSRLLAPFVLPQEFSRVLYLDSDLVILTDVSPLYDLPLKGAALIAARDYDLPTAEMGVFNYKEMGIRPEAAYFNSGVLVMNLDRWREDNITERVLHYMKEHRDSLRYHDQGGMNAVLHDAWIEMDPTWNQTRSILRPDFWETMGFPLSLWRRLKDHPKIIHFTGKDKPWLPEMRRPGYTFFYKYLKKTEFRGAYKSLTLEWIIGFRLHLILWISKRNRYPFFKGRWS